VTPPNPTSSTEEGVGMERRKREKENGEGEKNGDLSTVFYDPPV